MHRYGIEGEMWFELAKAGLERRGFRLRVQQRSIVVEKDERLPRLMGSAREFLEFVERQGLRVEMGAFDAADRYGDARTDVSGRASESHFETPAKKQAAAQPRFAQAAAARSAPAPGVFGRAGVAEAPRAEVQAPPREQDRSGAMPFTDVTAELRARCAMMEARNAELELLHTELRAELARAAMAVHETAKQRDLYHMSAAAADDRVRVLQTELNGAGDERGPEKRFNQLRRYLARELHPDLAGEDAAERVIREAIFKRVWAKIEQLQ